MNGSSERTKLLKRLLGQSELIQAAETSSNVPVQIMEKSLLSMGGQDLIPSRTKKVLNRLITANGSASVETLKNAVEELENLLLEEVEHNNSIPSRLEIHTCLAMVHDALGNKAIAVQHRTVREELKSMMGTSMPSISLL